MVSNMAFIFHFIYGMSSFPVTFTPSFFKMVKTTNQYSIHGVNLNQRSQRCHGGHHHIIDLDDGKKLTGKPDQFDGKNPWLSG